MQNIVRQSPDRSQKIPGNKYTKKIELKKKRRF